MNVIGIDPGKKGALVCLDNYGVRYLHAMPIEGNEIDWLLVADIIQEVEADDIILEEVHAMYGSSAGATFAFGGAYHGIIAICAGLGRKPLLVQPKAWQRVVYEGIPEIRKPDIEIKKGKRKGQTTRGRRDTKAMSLLAAQKLFPDANLLANSRCKVPHDGIVDALLIAEYGRRTL